MSGKVPRSDYAAAKELYREFTGEAPDRLDTIRLPSYKVAIVIGECDGLMYTTQSAGETERYIFEFTRTRARRMLCVTQDEKQLLLVGVSCKSRDSGINDT